MNRRSRRKNYVREKLRLQKGVRRSDDWARCKKVEKHTDYMQLKDVERKLRELGFAAGLLLQFIQLRWLLTALMKIMVANKNDEEEEQFGSCFIQKVEQIQGKSCPCCKDSKEPWYRVTVSTALHVVSDSDMENFLAAKCEVRHDYESDDETPCDKSQLLVGYKVHSIDKDGDKCVVECVTHNLGLFERFDDWINQHYELGSQLKKEYGNLPQEEAPVVIVSHPHGLGKRVSIGQLTEKVINKEVRDEQDFCEYYYTAVTCKGSSGASVYILGRWLDGFGYWFGLPHSHKGVDEEFGEGISSPGVEATWQRR